MMLREKTFFLSLLLLCGCDNDYLHGKKCDSEQRCLPGYVCELSSGLCIWPWEIPDGQDGGDGVCSNIPGSQNILTNVKLDGKEPPVELDPGSTANIEVEYALSQIVGCQNCSNQFLFGLKSPSYGHQPLLCSHVGIPPPCPATLKGKINFAFQIPFTPGVYDLTSTTSQDNDCDSAMANFLTWMNRRAAQAAVIVVREPECPDSYAYLTEVKLNSQSSPLTVEPNQKIIIEANYTASRLQTCIDCQVQLVLGLDDQPVFCQELGILPACPESQHGKVSGEFFAPVDKNSYLLKYSIFAANDCGAAQNQYRNHPPARVWTAGVIVVK